MWIIFYMESIEGVHSCLSFACNGTIFPAGNYLETLDQGVKYVQSKQ